MTIRRPSDAGLAIIKEFEGLHDGDKRTPILEPEADPVGIYTIGWGHALFEKGEPVKNREVAYRIWRNLYPAGMTLADADELLKSDAQRVCEQVVANTAAAPELNQNQLDALVSFTYNVGIGNFKTSTLRSRVLAGDWVGAAAQFPRWNKSGGAVLPGLVRRRKLEADLFMKEPTDAQH